MITLLTDFGLQDTFVGVIKGVMKSIAPNADMIDLTHQIPAQDIRSAAFALKTAYRYFPAKTVNLIVVDPGVGSTRQAIAAQIGDRYYVCPDNGILSYVLQSDTLQQAVVLDNPHYHLPSVSRTFHGRDIFAPVAAHLANGVALSDLGTPITDLQTFTPSQPRFLPNTIKAHVIYCDAYGNAFTDLTEDQFVPWTTGNISITAAHYAIAGPVTSYSDVRVGAPLALFGSSGHLEIAIRNGNARFKLGLEVGSEIFLTRQ